MWRGKLIMNLWKIWKPDDTSAGMRSHLCCLALLTRRRDFAGGAPRCGDATGRGSAAAAAAAAATTAAAATALVAVPLEVPAREDHTPHSTLATLSSAREAARSAFLPCNMAVALALALTVALWLAPEPAGGGRVLALFQLNHRSHFAMFEVLMKALAARGHQVDVLSHFPQMTPPPNYRDLSVKGSLPDVQNKVSVQKAISKGNFLNSLNFFWVQNLEMCEEVYKHAAVQQLLRSNESYDLVITELFGVDCMMGFAHKFGAPVVNMAASVMLPWANDRVANPDNPAYVPIYFLPFAPPLSFGQRVANALALAFYKVGSYLVGDRSTEQLLRRHFGPSLPSLAELQRNVSLVLVNSHFSLNQARPSVPAVIEVAGMHIAEPRPLPEDLLRFVEGAREGVVYLSFGSLVRWETLPEARLRFVAEELGALPQRVVWKLDATDLPFALPPNVYARPWLPQADILAHPNVRLFISHAGLMGMQEALHWGVPMVVMPFFADHHLHARNCVQRGLAVGLNSASFTREQFRDAVSRVLGDPSYRENARRLSEQFRDRPQAPLETAVWWTEYVMRHRGAPQLRSAAVDLSWPQLWLLDVAAVLLAIFALIVAALWLIVRAVTNCLCRKPVDKASKTRKAKTS